MFSDAANRRYTFWTIACWTLFLALTALASAIDRYEIAPLAATALSAMIAVPIAVHAWATFSLINGADEFVRVLTMKRFVAAWGISTTLYCAWGFSEHFAAAPPAPAWTIYPLFWVAFAVASTVIRSTR